MNQITPDDHKVIHNRIMECFIKVLGYAPSFSFTFSSKLGKCGGLAWRQTCEMEFNELLYLNNKKKFIHDIVAHETAHCIQQIMYPNAKQAHGPEFRAICKILGSDPSTYPVLDISSVAKNEYKYDCVCKSYFVTKLLHNRMAEGNHRECRECKQRLIFDQGLVNV